MITPEGERAASVHIADGRITQVGTYDVDADIDAGDSVVMPGVIDTHVHVNEPGRTEWEGFETATRSAAAGGVTTILDMPLNSIPATVSVAALEGKRAAAREKSFVNVEFIGGVVPGNADQIQPLADAGVRAFKCFLTPSGVDEFPNVTEEDLRIAFPLIEKTGLPLMVHAEDSSCLLTPLVPSRHYGDYLASRPVESERSAIAMLIRLMEWWPAKVHIVHLSSAKSLALIRAAKSRGLPLTVETCPHYLTFAAEEIPDGATEYKCAPPIREAYERDALWSALIAGDIDLIASDHSPCPPSMKESDGNFFGCWGGIASLQLTLSAVWTGARARGCSPVDLAKWMCTSTAKLAGLSKTKGAIAPGFDGDVIIWDPDAAFLVDGVKLQHRHHVTPYNGRRLIGVIEKTVVGGKIVFSQP